MRGSKENHLSLTYYCSWHPSLKCNYNFFFYLLILFSQLPVADGYMSRQVGLIVQHGPTLSSDLVPEVIFSSRRLWKPEIGPIRPGSIATVSKCTHRMPRLEQGNSILPFPSLPSANTLLAIKSTYRCVICLCVKYKLSIFFMLHTQCLYRCRVFWVLTDLELKLI